MPSRNVQQTAKDRSKAQQKRGKARIRKLNFQSEPWYAEAARKISAVRNSSEQRLAEVSAAPLAPE